MVSNKFYKGGTYILPSVNEILTRMRNAGKIQEYKEKGNAGEDAVFTVCSNRGGASLLYHSLMYPYQTSRSGRTYTGNIKYENGEFHEYTDKSINDEIDVLYITKYRIFPIEVKSYSAYRIDVYDHWCNKGNTPVDKSPIAQAEKHARMLYHAIYDVIPDGNPDYIIPIVCFVDHCTLRDDRSELFQDYIPVCVLNNLNKTLNRNNIPLDYDINLQEVNRVIKNKAVSIKKTA